MNTTSIAAVKFSVEVITLAVSDVERALLRFYVDRDGFTLDVDHSPNDAYSSAKRSEGSRQRSNCCAFFPPLARCFAMPTNGADDWNGRFAPEAAILRHGF
jgi:hypothetical protein